MRVLCNEAVEAGGIIILGVDDDPRPPGHGLVDETRAIDAGTGHGHEHAAGPHQPRMGV